MFLKITSLMYVRTTVSAEKLFFFINTFGKEKIKYNYLDAKIDNDCNTVPFCKGRSN